MELISCLVIGLGESRSCSAYISNLSHCLLQITPESPRYLVSVGRIDEARKVLMEFHGGNNEIFGGALVDFELKETRTTVAREQEAKCASFGAYFNTKGNILKFFICCFMGYAQY